MEYTADPLDLPLKTPFRIAHGISTVRQNVLVRFGRGVGEAALPPYYPHQQAEVLAFLRALDFSAWLAHSPFPLQDALAAIPEGPAAARAALDMAMHDHWAQELGFPLYRLWGLSPQAAPRTAFTLGIPENLTAFEAQLPAAAAFPILKLKLGSGDPDFDADLVRLAAAHTDATLCVDANGGWTVEEASRLIPELAAYELAFIEQPIATSEPEPWQRLRAQLPAITPPLIADESIQSAQDVLRLAEVIDGINIKVAKAGGLQPARQWIGLARTLGLQVMLGCMVESSVALTAAAHLAPLVDYADLDGNLNLQADPFRGVVQHQGQLQFPATPGLGLRPA